MSSTAVAEHEFTAEKGADEIVKEKAKLSGVDRVGISKV